MPRASAARRQHGAATPNALQARPESGVVAAGKRLQKQKSNGHLNASPRSDRPPVAVPATPPRTNGHARYTAHDAQPDGKVAPDLPRRASVAELSESSSSSSESFPSHVLPRENHCLIDVNAAKNPAVHRDAGPVSLAVTVLRSCPLYDTIAILIVLLQLPPTFLSIIHLLYTALTCVPPSISAHSAFSLTGIFEGALSAPSFATMVVVDALVLLVWAFLWKPLQDLALDLAQLVIALTLGGGSSNRNTTMKNMLVCLGIIGATHLSNGSLRPQNLGLLFSPATATFDADEPFEPVDEISRRSTRGLFRSIIAIHILTQGVVRCIRDWYVRREREDTRLAACGDPEAAKGSLGTPSDGTTKMPDLDPNAFPPANVDKTLSAKQKRKQSAQVRTRQPLWAALASTKIIMVKEYESSHTLLESAGAKATDVHNLGNAPFDHEADRVWITYIGFDQVCFNTSFFPHFPPQDSASEVHLEDYRADVDRSKPFFVRVNQTVWAPTRISPVDPDAPTSSETRWCGEIIGLAPQANYEIEFVSTVDFSSLFSASVRTPHAPAADVSIPLPAMAQDMSRNLRPGSPITTLKTSIATAETKLNEERNRQKRDRKEQKSKMNSTRKELERLTSSIASAGGNDDRLRQKVQQSNLHMKQADESMVSMSHELENLQNLPDDDVVAWTAGKKAYHAEKDIHHNLRSEFLKTKQQAERATQSLSSEVASLQQKRERMQARIAKLSGEQERITDANAKGLDEAQRRATERAVKQTERARAEKMYSERIETLTPQVQEMQQTLHTLWGNINSMQFAFPPMPPSTLGSSSFEPTEATGAAMASPWASAAAPAVPASSFLSPSAANSPVPHAAQPSQTQNRRGRSSSMLSNVSGFTQSSGEERQAISSRWQEAFAATRDGRRSDGASSSSGASSAGPRSPVVSASALGTSVLAAAAAPAAQSSRWAGQWEDA